MVFYSNIDPVLVHLGPLEIRYYGLAFLVGFLIGYFMFPYLARLRGLKLTKDDSADLFFYIAIFGVIGSRILYILIYNLKFYLQNPFEMIAVWHGGLSFHGGFLGALLAFYYFARKKGLHFYDVADIVAIPAAIGFAIGRVANFINGELYGRITTMPWGVKFPGVEGFRHPSQLYESFKNLMIFAVLWNLKSSKKLAKGTLFWLFVTMYGGLRFIMEFFRQPDEQLGFFFKYFSMGQIICSIMFIVGAFMLWYVNRRSIKLK